MIHLQFYFFWVIAGAVVAQSFDTVAADDRAAGLKLIETAILARGGEAKLAKYPAERGKLKGTYAGQPFACVYSTLPPDRWRYEIKVDDSAMVGIVNGSTGWFIRLDDKSVIDMTADQLTESRESLYAGWLESLVPLKGKDFVLTTIGDIKIDGKLAAGIRVSMNGHRDVALYFDSATGLLVKTERRIKDAEQGGNEMIEETFLSEYEDMGGVKISKKQVMTHDGKPFAEWSRTEVELLETLDKKLFEKPERN